MQAKSDDDFHRGLFIYLFKFIHSLFGRINKTVQIIAL